MRRRGLNAGLVAAVLATVLVVVPVSGQERLVVPSPVLTVNQDELFDRSAFGQRIAREIEDASAELGAENRKLEAELAEEERRLTELRPTTDPEAFRAMASAFDARVVEVRRVQDQKGRDLSRRPEEARQEFFRAAVPILADLVRERGAVAILDVRAVILSADAIDITEDAIQRIDAAQGDGTGAPGTPGTEAPAPEAPAAPAAPEPGATAP